MPTSRPSRFCSRSACRSRPRAGRERPETTAAQVRQEQQAAEQERAAKAEAEQAALDQLKEENPEAYEKPSKPPEGDETAEGEARESGDEEGVAPPVDEQS